jgi:hypothetical protein
MLGGEPIIDLQDWKENTDYRNGYNASSTAVQLFWDYLAALDQGALAKILQFSTGASRLPAGGFKSLPKRFGLYRVSCNETVAIVLPTSHTCYYQIDLPDYQTSDTLKERFNLSLAYSQGFDE